MARPPFTLNIPGAWNCTTTGGAPITNGTSPSALHADEVSTGSGSPVIDGWRNPNGYTMTYRYYRRAQGICRNLSLGNPAFGQIYTGCVGATNARFDSENHFNSLVTESSLNGLASPLANRALIKARGKMKRSDINLGVAFAERNATARLLGDTAGRLGKAFNNLKRGRVRAAMRDLGISNARREPRGSNVPNKWLELQYGWKPFLSDVFGACDALSRRDNSDFRVTATASVTNNQTYTREWIGFDAGIGGAQATIGAFCRIDAIPENDLKISLASLGVTNPALIVWELVPYSFVVDWALPVGEWLESLDALLGYGTSSTSTSTFIRCIWKGVGTTRPPQSGFQTKNEYIESKRFVKLTRVATSGVPLPTFPGLKDPRSLGHMANGLSLLASAFGRRR